MASVLGIASGIIKIFSFVQSHFGDADVKGSVLRIQVGLNGVNGLDQAGGDLPTIQLFNEAGESLGRTKHTGKIEDGAISEDIVVLQSTRQQPTYGLFGARHDPICIAYLTIVWPDGQKFGWLGDWGQWCDGPWFYSNIVLEGRLGKLPCMWLAPEREPSDPPNSAFQVHFPDFVSTDGKEPRDRDFYCDGPAFKFYGDPPEKDYIMTSAPSGQSKARSKRTPGMNSTTAPQSPPFKRQSKTVYSTDSRLVISSDVTQSSAALCASATSLGPDFLNIAEGQFCQMSMKRLHPVCSEIVTDNCFNSDTLKLAVGGVGSRDLGYSKVIDWRGGSSSLGRHF